MMQFTSIIFNFVVIWHKNFQTAPDSILLEIYSITLAIPAHFYYLFDGVDMKLIVREEKMNNIKGFYRATVLLLEHGVFYNIQYRMVHGAKL
jgi:hypothetical protein